MSKYIEFQSMTMATFARSPAGTVAHFFLVPGSKARHEIGKSLKSACSRSGTTCTMETTELLVQQDDETWLKSRIIRAEITGETVNKEVPR